MLASDLKIGDAHHYVSDATGNVTCDLVIGIVPSNVGRYYISVHVLRTYKGFHEPSYVQFIEMIRHPSEGVYGTPWTLMSC